MFRNAYCLGSNVGAVCAQPQHAALRPGYFRWKARPAARQFSALPEGRRYETYHHGKNGNIAVVIEKLFDTTIPQRRRERTSGEPGQTIVDERLIS